MTLAELYAQIANCSRCPLRATCTQPVHGHGEVGAKYFIIGRDPGREEDKFGIPFIGAAGHRLNKLLTAAGIDKGDCYIDNIVRCRPPNNRPPRVGEIKACRRWIELALAVVQPEIVITLGGEALSMFSKHGIKQTHGTCFTAEIKDLEELLNESLR